jgi:replicative DNA helicase
VSEPVLADKIPPQSLEMEQAALGSMLIEAAAIEKVRGLVEPADFYREAHRVIFEAILSLVERHQPVDLLTLQEQLRDQGVLDDVGGTAYLVQLTEAPASAANASHYAKHVEEKATLRRLIEASHRIQEVAYSATDKVDDIVDQSEQAIFAVANRRSTSFFRPMKTLVHDMLEKLEARSDNTDAVTGLPTPFHRLDDMTAGLQDSDLIIIAARPAMGKTSLALGIAQHIALKTRRPAAIFSLEMSCEQLCMRMICSEGRVNAHHLRTGRLDPSHWRRVGDACSVLSEAPIYIDDSPVLNALDIRGKCRRLMAEQRDLGLVVVDYLQLMRGIRSTENRTQEISEIARSLKALARELHRPVIALSQLSRAVEQRPNKRPMLSDLRESGSIEAEADVVVFIYRDAYYEELRERTAAKEAGQEAPRERPRVRDRREDRVEMAELIIAKQRNGPTGKIEVAFHPAFARFDNLAVEMTPP